MPRPYRTVSQIHSRHKCVSSSLSLPPFTLLLFLSEIAELRYLIYSWTLSRTPLSSNASKTEEYYEGQERNLSFARAKDRLDRLLTLEWLLMMIIVEAAWNKCFKVQSDTPNMRWNFISTDKFSFLASALSGTIWSRRQMILKTSSVSSLEKAIRDKRRNIRWLEQVSA